MPYFVYRMSAFPILRMEKIEQHDTFRTASGRAKALREGLAAEFSIRVIFAENELQAEDMLSQVRAPIPNPNDD
jgi:hypothetical protein